MDIPSFRSGDRLTAQTLQKLASAIQAATIQKGVGYTFERTGAGTRLRIEPQKGGGGSSSSEAALTPFQLVLGYPNPQAPEFPVVRIHGNSFVSIIESGQIYPVTGLGAVIGSDLDNEDDQGQFPLPEIGQSVWLEMTVDGFAVTSISVWYGYAGVDGWLNYPTPVQVEPVSEENPYPYIWAVRQIVAHVTYANDPRPGTVYAVGSGESVEYRKVLQVLNTNLGVQVLMVNGIPAPMLVPWHGPFQIE